MGLRVERAAMAAVLAVAAALALGGTACFAESEALCPSELEFCGPLRGEANGYTAAQVAQLRRSAGAALLLTGIMAAAPSAAGLLEMRAQSRRGPHRTKASLHILFVSHLLSAWGDRMWQMATPLIFMDLFRDTLVPTATYTLVVYVVIMLRLPAMGLWIDRTDRLSAQQWTCLGENVCIVGTCALICGGVLVDPAEWGVSALSLSNAATLVWFAMLILLGCVGELLNSTGTVSLEKDWVVVIADTLHIPVGEINTILRRIDLTCKALAPALFAALYQGLGVTMRARIFYGAALLGLWNLISCPLEICLLRIVYARFADELSEKLHEHKDGTRHTHTLGHLPHAHPLLLDETTPGHHPLRTGTGGAGAAVGKLSGRVLEDVVLDVREKEHVHVGSDGTMHRHKHEVGDLVPHHHLPGHDEGVHVHPVLLSSDIYGGPAVIVGYAHENRGNTGTWTSLRLGASVYMAQPIFGASLAYTLLYMTVLDNGPLMTSYLEWAELPPAWVGSGRGAGAIFGLVGTFVYPWLARRLEGGTRAAGFVSLWVFCILLLPVGILLVIEPSGEATSACMVAVVAVSRAALWAFDLAITELCQTTVPEDDRGIFSTVQTASYQFFYVFIQVLGIIAAQPRRFPYLALFSIAVVWAAGIVYSIWHWRHAANALVPASTHAETRSLLHKHGQDDHGHNHSHSHGHGHGDHGHDHGHGDHA
ncbi:Solute carrier family 40 member 1 [Hondaea fermentalgiana]|uniref:Solute carrier family 40 member 1 n=1 Tax=Hondaea fermentalgiana TaxID=2315210 RepID=A0A2R5GTY1_9STRA|nr:Solute carrier family 40 member 1 [Hondaea fermentalgiana]|eukprot:GBG32103.1 Solute carrier family 40 member 1 [Hondaea fermentalgiana]